MKRFKQIGPPPDGRGGKFLEHWRTFDEDWTGLSKEYRPHIIILCKVWCEIEDVEEILETIGRNDDRSAFYMKRWSALNSQYMAQIQKLREYISKRSPGSRRQPVMGLGPPTEDEIPDFGGDPLPNKWAN